MQAFCRRLGNYLETWLPLRLSCRAGELQGRAQRPNLHVVPLRLSPTSLCSMQAFCRQLGCSMGTWLPLRLGSGVGKLQGSAQRPQRSSHSQQSKGPGCNICSCIARPSDAACLIPPRGQAQGTLCSIERLPEMIRILNISCFHAIDFSADSGSYNTPLRVVQP